MQTVKSCLLSIKPANQRLQSETRQDKAVPVDMKVSFSSKAFLASLFVASALMGVADAQRNSSFFSLTGYLADMLCTRLEIAPDGANMLLNPMEHTVMCELLPNCLRSGYGLTQDVGSRGNSLYRVGAIFDEPGNAFVVALLRSMNASQNDLRVKITGTFVSVAPPTITPAITNSANRSWPAMNEIPFITIDSLDFCNYHGPDAKFKSAVPCARTVDILNLLASDDAGQSPLAEANFCFRDEIKTSISGGFMNVNPDGCADHATFRDVKRADPETCSQAANSGCEETCEAQDTCVVACVNGCGDPITSRSGKVAKTCCLDGCGNPIVDGCGFPYYDAWGNPTLADGTTACPAASVAENMVNECVDGFGSPVADACGNPVRGCCLDPCGNPILSPCGWPFLDQCGNPALNAAGDACTNLGANVCLPTDNCQDKNTCRLRCLDACGNPITLSTSKTAKSCCLDACGNPIVDGCGFPYYDPCGNPTLEDGTTTCPANNVAENEVNDCVNGCGSPLLDACGNPLNRCCLDTCGNPILNPCGFPWIDACGNPTTSDGGPGCPTAQLGENGCVESCGTVPMRRRHSRSLSSFASGSRRTKGVRKVMIGKHKRIEQAFLRDVVDPSKRSLAGHAAANECHKECVDQCGNPLAVDITGKKAKACCLDACGNPLLDGCGFPFYDACGNPTSGNSGTPCPADRIGEYDHNECVDSCGNPLQDPCGSPLENCCLDACGNPILDPCGFPWRDACGNPTLDQAGTACANLGANSCLQVQCRLQLGCVDACGNPITQSNGRTAKLCCLDSCGNPISNGCGFPYYDPCGNPTLADGSTACPASNVAKNDVNDCVDGCGSPLADACGNPVNSCCLDACGNPILDPCGQPWLDACGNPVANQAGDACTNLGNNVCLDNGAGGSNGEACIATFPPASGSFQCEGLVSACDLTAEGSMNSSHGVPVNILGRKWGMRTMSEHNVPPYTPLRKDLKIKIPASPTGKKEKKALNPAHGGVIGLARNGIPIVYEHPGEGNNTMLFDSCGGHADLANRYHYHLPPICLLRSLGGLVPRVSDWWLAPDSETQWPGQASTHWEKSPLIGWAIDGNPIFGPYNPDNGELVIPAGETTGGVECSVNTLDECNGMTLLSGVYAYFMTATAPFVPTCLMGNVPADAFVDGGKLNGEVSICPFEGTAPRAGTEICDEKTIIFTDESCPGNADRLFIRSCFDSATSSFIGEPSCRQMQMAIQESMSCFKYSGCCHDLESTIEEWVKLYPALDECSLAETGCLVFGKENVVEITVELGVPMAILVPDVRARLRASIASNVGVDKSHVHIKRVSGNNDTSSVVFAIAYATRAEAATAAAKLDTSALLQSLASATGYTVSSVQVWHAIPPEIPDLWSKKNKVGLGVSMAAVLVLLALIVALEDVVRASKSHDDGVGEEAPLSAGKDLGEADGFAEEAEKDLGEAEGFAEEANV